MLQEMKYYGLSDISAICGPQHPPINTEDFISYESTLLLLPKHLQILQELPQLTRLEVKKGVD